MRHSRRQENDRYRRQVPRIALKKLLGQHHLTDASLCDRLVDHLEPRDELVIEIGPGGGVLTGALLDRGAEVWALEVDPEWAFELGRRIRASGLRVAVADALDLPWERLPAGCRVAGNLPFNIATPLIEALLLRGQAVPRAGFLVQKEVAERLLAEPGSSDYGSLSVLVAARARTRRLGTVPRGSFRPPPRVDGAFVGFELIEPPLEWRELPGFARTVRAAFALRRKTLRNSLASMWGRERANAAVEALGFEALTRAETLGVEDFLRLYRWFSASSSSFL